MDLQSFNFEQSYFELFNLPTGLSLDEGVLRESFMQLQRQYHPDKFAAGTATESRLAVQISSFINEAQQILASPLSRAEYCLQRKGVSLGSETDSKMDSAFLMEQMELRELLEDIESAQDPFEQIDQFRSELGAKVSELFSVTAGHLDADNLVDARDAVRKWQFLDKLAREANALEAQLDNADS